MADLVIRGALLCDGSGREAARGDLAVSGGRIAAVGRVAERGAREIDGAGLALAPGFIDVHTHYDCQLFWDPQASPSPWHGVTTVLMGNFGFTIAPCRAAERQTLMALARALADLEPGVIEIAPRTTIGPPADKAEEQRFFAELARSSGKVVSWAPLLDNPFAPGSARKIIEESAELQAGGVQVVPQVGCRPLEVRFDFTEPAFYLEQNPFWRPLMVKSRDERRRLFAEAEFRAELGRQTGFVAALAQGWDRLVLRLAASEGVRRWQDRSVAEIAAAEGRAPLDAFCDLVLEADLATQWGVVLMNHDERAVAELIRHPAGLLALSDAGAHVDTLCDQGFTTYLLGHWVRDLGALPLEQAVRLVTAVPAERYGLHGRGRLAPGYAADLVLFDPARVAMRPTEMVYDLPRGQRRLLQRAEGIVDVLVNGTPVVADGAPTGRRPGRVLRGGV